MQVRVASAADAQKVGSILARSYPAMFADHYPPALLAAALAVITRPHLPLLQSGRYYVAEDEDEPVGCGGWSVEPPGSHDTVAGVGHLRHFAVVADRAKRGVGRLLYQTCEAAARAHGVTRLDVYSSLHAEPFYAAMGFARIAEIEVPIPGVGGFPSIHMRRSL